MIRFLRVWYIKVALTCTSFNSFYCVNVWKLWTVFLLWNFYFD